MMDILQWAGMICIAAAYLFYVRDSFAATLLTILGCCAVFAWAMLLAPIAWGVAALELVIIAICLHNIWLLTR